MLKRLSNWFGGAQSKPRPQQPPTKAPASAQAPVLGEFRGTAPDENDPPATAVPDPSEVSGAFYRLLLDPDGSIGQPPAREESRLIAEIERQLDRRERLADDLPRFPTILPELLKALNDEHISHTATARIIRKDPSLSLRIVERANTVTYRQAAGPTTSIEQAIRVLGSSGLRRVASQSLLHPIVQMQSRAHSDFSGIIWRHSLATARLCQLLAETGSQNPFQAYLLGLIHELGKILIFRSLLAATRTTQPPRSVVFATLMAERSAEYSHRIVAELAFPKELIQALQNYASQATAPPDALEHLLGLAHFASKVGTLCARHEYDRGLCIEMLRRAGFDAAKAEAGLRASLDEQSPG